MRQTSFLPDVAPPTTRELIDKLARGKEQKPDASRVTSACSVRGNSTSAI